MSRPLGRHVHPTSGRAHETDSAGPCWCGPRVEVLCTQCEGDRACWYCGGERWVEVDPADVKPGDRTIVIHNREEA